jgi:dolichyl-phosphate-mannose--protein O-mannosyl transferase
VSVHRPHRRDPESYKEAVYGSILVTALIAALRHEHVPVRVLTITLVGTMLVFWLAHVWSSIVAERLRGAARLSVRQVRDLATEEWPMLEVAFVPVVALVVGWLGFVSDERRQIYGRTLPAILFGIVDGLLGLAIVALEVAVH